MNDSVEYYNDNAQEFFDSTINIDMSVIYNRFLSLVPEGGSILDAGCGSGRDALAFQNRGYKVEAFDASNELCQLASSVLDNPVRCIRFDQVEWIDTFHGVWACASLLHVSRNELSSVFQRLLNTLQVGGVMYCSFKYGTSDRDVEGRSFTDMNESSVVSLLSGLRSNLHIVDNWITEDQRPGRDEKWLNIILQIA